MTSGTPRKKNRRPSKSRLVQCSSLVTSFNMPVARSSLSHVWKCVQSPGFTRIDFLATISTILLVTSLCVPSFVRWRDVNAAVHCLRNHKQLSAAWLLYAADNGSLLCNNFLIPGTQSTVQGAKFATWANNIMTWGVNGVDDRSNTNLNLVRRSVLAPYSSDPIGMIKCPSDRFLSGPQKAMRWTARLRSVSMNALLGRYDNSTAAPSNRSWDDPNFRQLFRLEDIPHPERAWVTIDEQADSINDGVFIVQYSAILWSDIPGSYHGGATTLGFADGHGEIHHWLSSRTKLPVRFSYSTGPFDAQAKQDFLWLRERTPFVRFQ